MVPSWIENVTDIACGEERNLVLRNDGTVAEWGYNSWQSVPADLENVIAIDCNSNGFNAALKANGDVICWGYDHNNGHFNFPDINPLVTNNCGCTDETAINFVLTASIDDGSCIGAIGGCTDNTAINYNSSVNTDDGSCISQEEYTIDSLNNLIEQATTSLLSLQHALDTWNTTINLNSGWNIIGYGCPASIDVAEGLSNHTEIITIVKNNNGQAYIPEFGFNGIGDFTPGFGYQIKLTEAIEGFSLCDWYVNDIPEDNIVSLQEELASARAELDSIMSSGCSDI